MIRCQKLEECIHAPIQIRHEWLLISDSDGLIKSDKAKDKIVINKNCNLDDIICILVFKFYVNNRVYLDTISEIIY